jgi:dipeptidyl aminopeptidase/acylaminoacyl peptidase
MMNKVLVYTIGIIAFILILSIYGLLISIFPRRHITDIKPSDLGLKYEEITLQTSDNIKLKAWFIPNNKTKNAIIICHGYPFDKGNVLSFATFLHNDYNLLFFDFRAMGESEGKYTTVGYKEVEDLKAAVNYLKNKNIKNIGALGFSLGAATIIMANSKDIKAIVADSSYANLDLMINSLYRQFFFLKYPFTYTTKLLARLIIKIDTKEVSPEKAIKQTTTPILLIHGKKDSQIPVENSYRLNKANLNTELWIIEEADHGQAHYLRKEEYEKKVLDFFNENLK